MATWASLQHGGWALQEKEPGESYITFYDLALAIMQFFFCHIMFLKKLTESHPVQGMRK